MTMTNGTIYPSEGRHLRNIHTKEVYPNFITPAKSLTMSDFDEISDDEYQAHLAALEQITAEEALEIITGGAI